VKLRFELEAQLLVPGLAWLREVPSPARPDPLLQLD
jgi:hypothetical protein